MDRSMTMTIHKKSERINCPTLVLTSIISTIIALDGCSIDVRTRNSDVPTTFHIQSYRSHLLLSRSSSKYDAQAHNLNHLERWDLFLKFFRKMCINEITKWQPKSMLLTLYEKQLTIKIIKSYWTSGWSYNSKFCLQKSHKNSCQIIQIHYRIATFVELQIFMCLDNKFIFSSVNWNMCSNQKYLRCVCFLQINNNSSNFCFLQRNAYTSTIKARALHWYLFEFRSAENRPTKPKSRCFICECVYEFVALRAAS